MLMKIVQFFKKAVGGSMILAALACPVFTSCADFSTDLEDVRQDLSDLEDRVEALEAKLNTDLAALQTLLESQIAAVAGDLTELEGKVDGLVTVKECKQNSKGEWEVTLTDGTKFTVYPEYEQDYSGIVTTTTIDGVLYWAVFDENGKAKAITVDGQLVPVVDAVPQTKKGDDGYFYVSFDGGETWEPTGVTEPCVFAGAEIVLSDNFTDEEEAQGYGEETPMYVVLTLPDGNTITVSIDGAARFFFGSNYGGPVSSQYASYGETVTLQAQVAGIESWIKEVPSGWVITESTALLQYGIVEFNITAPTAEAIASGAALAEGNLKVLAVAEGGKSITSSVRLTTRPFNSFAAAKGAITLEMNNGVGGYLLGVSTVADYNAEAILAELKPIVEAFEEEENWWTGEIVLSPSWSPWYVDGNATTLDDNYMSQSIEGYPISDLVNIIDLEPGAQYIVWAVALNSWYDDTTYQSGYTVGSIVSVPYLNAFINLDETKTEVSFNDIQIHVEFDGVTAFYGYFASAQYGAPSLNEIASEVNDQIAWGYYPYDVTFENGIYDGNPNDLVMGWQPIEPGATYYLYLVPAVEGKTKYTAADVYYYEWTTDALAAGGKATVTAGEATLEFNKISVPLTASDEDAAYIYYAYVDPQMLPTISDKQAYLVESGKRIEGASGLVSESNLLTNTTRTLLALAIDKYGCYGDVFQQDYTTKTLEYASATVTAEVQGTPSTSGYVKISCSADVEEYLYWYGAKDNYVYNDNFGGTVDSVSEYFALNPLFYYIKHITPAEIPADGIEMTRLTVGAPHVFAVSAKLTDGTYTKATLVEFNPSLDLGNFVYATDDNGNENAAWVAAKPTVNAKTESIGDFTHVTWSVDVPAGYTAKTAYIHEEYLKNYPTAKDKVQFILTYEYIDLYDVVAGEQYSYPYGSKGGDIYTVVCDAEGNYYETYVTKLNITGGFGV